VSQENVAVARKWIDGWNHNDFDAWMVDVHPQIEFLSSLKGHVEGERTAFRGPAEMRRFWDEWHVLWDDLTIDVSELRDLGDTVVALARVRARGNTSGVELESPVGYVFEFDDGLLRRTTAYLGHANALKAAGLAH
jgi:ketosteroid isomerase-like protein